ncbi:MAG TPA: pyrroloquinoline quinone biosynthesis protein PqqE [Terrimicrobiaceae bacterium]
MNFMVPRPIGLLAELTHRCPLHCPYCSNPLNLIPRRDEVAPEIWERVLQEAAELGVLQVGFSGGEPLLYQALERLVGKAGQVGLYTNLITSGVGLTFAKARALREAGLDTVQVSFQAASADVADAIAGSRAHEKKLMAVAAVCAAEIPWSANVVVHRWNIAQISDMIQLAEKLGAIRIELANTQFYGWAFTNRLHLLPTREQIEQARHVVERERERLRGRLQIVYVLPDYYETRPKPCLYGWGSRSLTINPSGYVLPCQAAEAIPDREFDNVLQKSLAEIWRGSSAFVRFRGTQWMQEPFKSCRFKEIDFGGCRCQAALLAGDASQADPVCEFSPTRRVVDAMLDKIQPDNFRQFDKKTLAFRRQTRATFS